MADKPQVVKLAQPGVDVKTAGDDRLVFNSNWPLLKIYKQGSFTTNDNTTANQPVVNHDLGYTPMFWFFSNRDMRDWNGSLGPNKIVERSEFNGPTGAFFPATDNKALWFEINPGFLLGPIRFYYYIFALDITKPYTAPTIKSGGVIGARNKKTVFKLAKAGKDISSSSLEDYIVHSAARSPMIHAVVPFTVKSSAEYSTGGGFTYHHNLGYTPMYFVYAKVSTHIGTNNPVPNSYLPWYTINSISGFSADEQKIVFNYGTLVGDEFSLVVLKDPFNIDYSVSITI